MGFLSNGLLLHTDNAVSESRPSEKIHSDARNTLDLSLLQQLQLLLGKFLFSISIVSKSVRYNIFFILQNQTNV